MSAESGTLTAFRRFWFAVKRSWATQESYWFWRWGRWEYEAGLYHGFGLCAVFFRDEFQIAIACFTLGASRQERE